MKAVTLKILAAVGFIAIFAAPVAAQAPYPSRPVRIVVPFAAGGGIDVSARLIAERLSKSLGQPFVVENLTGAAGIIGVDNVVRSAPDGYKLLYTPGGPLTYTPITRPNVPYKVLNDLVPISGGYVSPIVLAAPSNLGVKDFRAYRQLITSNPDKYAYATSGVGSLTYLSGTFINQLMGTKMTHVPYSGTSAIYADLITGRVAMMFDLVGSLKGYFGDGSVTGLAVIDRERIAGYESIPTIVEGGLPEMLAFDWRNWTMLLAPKQTPPDILQSLNTAVIDALKDPAVLKTFSDLTVSAFPLSLPQAGAFLEGRVKEAPALFDRMGLAQQ